MSTRTDVTRSAELYARAMKVLPGGVSRNAAFRDPHPLYAAHAEGCRITDIEGVTRLDFANNMASLIHGHADPDIVRAVTEQMRRGTAYNIGTEVEVRYAEHLSARVPGFDMMRFVNSGTEALMVGVKASRAFTGRPMIAKAEGAYHGAYDFVEVSQTPSPTNWGDADEPRRVALVKGTPESALNEVVVIPYNNIERSIALLERSKERLACLVLDLMPHRVGLNPASQDYVVALREWTTKNGVLLLLDEVITLRSHYTGLQEQYGVRPDLTAMGKMIGGGFPIGAIAGRADVMNLLNPRSDSYVYPHSGTFSANPISITAGLTAMEKFDRSEVARLNGMATRAISGIEAAIRETGVRASVTGGGSMLRVHMKASPPTNYREAHLTADENKRLGVMLDHMFDSGFILINSCSCALSTPMTDADIDELVRAMRGGFEKVSAMD